MNPKCKAAIEDMLQEFVTDVMRVFEFGNQKHPDAGETPNFLLPSGNKCSHKERGSGMLRHHAKAYADIEAVDEESNIPHILHGAACDAILYIRHKRNITHPEDK